MEGVAWNDQVVLFSSNPHGASPTLPFSYTVPGTGVLTHILANLSGGISANVVHANGMTTVTVSAGTQLTPNAQGVVQFTM
jgi:hypothetical protein